jgi:uncharacterized protein YjbI with pentapeptide repeats
LWDWLELLIVPIVLAAVAFLFNRAERRNEQAIAHDRFSENALQTYLTQMSGLLLEQNLALAGENDAEREAREVARTVARMRTLTALRQLDPARKAVVLGFLWDARLIRRHLERAEPPVIDLRGADLRDARLRSAQLRGASLRGADLSGADMRNASLRGADLSTANLRGANLYRADLSGTRLKFADLSGADLRAVTVTDETDLWRCTLRGAKLDKATAGHLDDAIVS